MLVCWRQNCSGQVQLDALEPSPRSRVAPAQPPWLIQAYNASRFWLLLLRDQTEQIDFRVRCLDITPLPVQGGRWNNYWSYFMTRNSRSYQSSTLTVIPDILLMLCDHQYCWGHASCFQTVRLVSRVNQVLNTASRRRRKRAGTILGFFINGTGFRLTPAIPQTGIRCPGSISGPGSLI